MRARLIFVLFLVFMAGSVQAAVMDLPAGWSENDSRDVVKDTQTGYESSSWFSQFFNHAGHYVIGRSEHTMTSYLQFGLEDYVGTVDEINTVRLYYNVTKLKTYQSDYEAVSAHHASDPSHATGNVKDWKVQGDELVGRVNMEGELGWAFFDVTDYIKADLQGGFDYAAFTFDPGYMARMEFTRFDDGAPYLKFYTGDDFASVPLPGAVWLLGSGLAGLVGLRRRKQ